MQKLIAPGARVVAHRDSVAPLLRSLSVLQVVAFGLVLLLSAAAAAAVVLAARGALDTHRFTIEVMHGIGATDLQVTHLFQRKILIDALVGSVTGGFAAGGVLLLLAGGAAFAGELTGGATLGLIDLFVLALLPIALTVLATWVARTAVLQGIARSPMISRLGSLLLLVYALGFVLFAFTLGRPAAADAAASDAAVVAHRRTRPHRACDRGAEGR